MGNRFRNTLLNVYTTTWRPYSRLILGGDNAGWVLDWEMREVGKIARALGVNVVNPTWRNVSRNQSVFFSDQFFLLNDSWLKLNHRIGFAYFHGLPNIGEPAFDQIYMALTKHHNRINRIQVSHTQMRDVILQSGIDPEKVFLIPIGINLDYFPFQTPETKLQAREKLGISKNAFVIGSFQKDGNGWGEGLEPKLVKGPDIFISVIEKLKLRIPEIHVLLSGPARGYVKKGLEAIGAPYTHLYLDSYPQVGELFQALDLYLVTSRQEGGPKAILESMASGVPIISTRVGQAMDLINQGQNGWLADVLDVDTVSQLALHVYNFDKGKLEAILLKGRATAEANSYPAQVPLWEKFMEGFVE
jgi:glycosyltransferase involved in cell wall biosynthesis